MPRVSGGLRRAGQFRIGWTAPAGASNPPYTDGIPGQNENGCY
jgi:hypothetical protein